MGGIMNMYLVVVLIIIVSSYFLEIFVEGLNIKQLSRKLPKEFIGYYDEEKYAKSQEYTRENSNFGLIQNSIYTAIIIPFILLGGFNYFDQMVRSLNYGPVITGIFFIFALISLWSLLELPFSIYDTFVIEEKYGFNKTTTKTFILDMVKNLFLSILIGIPILSVILWFFQDTGKMAPLYIWIILSLFQLFMNFLAPILILPMFNKLIPLEDGELKSAIESYAEQHNFHLQGVYKIDESKRSTKGNAFFTGFGKSRRIVLYDTLIEKHSVEELVGILAHEMGHFKLNHIYKLMASSFLQNGLVLFILSLFINNRALFDAFKMDELSIYASLIFFGFLYTPISLIISILMNIFSRKFEYDADRYAIKTTGKKDIIISALKKISVDSLSNLTPHPLKVFFYYSHPPILKRIEEIRKINE
jgi:STE24 endopeptidase